MAEPQARPADGGRSASAGIDAARTMAHGEVLARWGRSRPEKVAFVCGERSVTYGELDHRVNAVAHALARRGVAKGDRVAVLMGNNLEHIEVLLGSFRLGAVAVPISFRLAPPEAAFVVEDSGSMVLVVDEVFAPVAAVVRDLVPGLGTVLVNGDDPSAAGGGAESYREAMVAADDTPPGVFVTEHDAACIMYTSGTTGRPKGALLSHFNLFMNSVNSLSAQQLHGDDEVWYGVLPLFHIGGLNGILMYLLLGATSVIVPLGRFDPAKAVDDLLTHRVTSCCFVQMQWDEIVDHLGDSRPPFSLRRIVWGTSAAVIPLLEAMSQVFPGVPIYNFFGQTEMSSVTCVLPPQMFPAKIGSVGKPVMAVEARIVDDEMRDVTQGEVGEIVYRGPTVMQGYWGLPDATESAFDGGWFHSGDLCRLDDEGYIYVVDRKKDMIISGGENIYSAEVEAALVTYPGGEHLLRRGGGRSRHLSRRRRGGGDRRARRTVGRTAAGRGGAGRPGTAAEPRGPSGAL